MTNPAPCGTTAAHQRHRRCGEPIDDACRQAQTDATRQSPEVEALRQVASVYMDVAEVLIKAMAQGIADFVDGLADALTPPRRLSLVEAEAMVARLPRIHYVDLSPRPLPDDACAVNPLTLASFATREEPEHV